MQKHFDGYAYNTRYEIHNYELGDIPKLEKEFSLWDDVYHRAIPKYHYDEEKKILFLPRGYDYIRLETYIGKPLVYKKECNPRRKVTFPIMSPPRNEVQKEAVRFLSGFEEYKRMAGESQQVLSLPTSAGKTYCAISACSLLNTVTMVIVGTDDLRKQWRDRIKEYTKLPDSSICLISGRPVIEKLLKYKERKLANYAFYITTHTTLRSYMNSAGFDSLNPLFEKLGIGIKIVDEAHLQYLNTFVIDYATNVWKTFYLTATFAQSEQFEDALFQRAFNKVFKLRIAPPERKHVIYIALLFSSRANTVEKMAMKGKKGLSKHKYIEYALQSGAILEPYRYIINLFINRMRLEGKILVLSPKQDSCDILKQVTDEMLPNYATCVHYSGNKVDNFEPYGIIFATSSMLGTGNDIKGLRAIINLEPIRSKRNTLQVWGRLRMYAENKDTYYVEIVDKSIPSVMDMFRDRRKLLGDYCKQYNEVDLTKRG